ncbi:MAG: hypothetical protein ACREV6_00230 [Clostridium sp.]|uniref:hypothetical protein n=1 Tax=Clostridium sp. TaxID=1506 RepID=UPI003D6D8A4A
MKNNLINCKFILLTIIYATVCIIMIKYFTAFNAIALNIFEKVNFPKIVDSPAYTTTLSKKIASNNYVDDPYTLNEPAPLKSYYTKKSSINSNIIDHKKTPVVNAHLPDYLMYKNVNITNLKEFLKSKNSILVQEPYFSAILSASKDFNLNPLVLFAIAGQEQSFVPKDAKNAYKIANNPFNVFISWKKYNTNIQDAASIAARTIVNLCKNKPNNIEAFTWVNRKYSEDKNWSKAVRSIFNKLEDNVSYWK